MLFQYREIMPRIEHFVTADQQIRYSDGEIAFRSTETTFSFLLFERVSADGNCHCVMGRNC